MTDKQRRRFYFPAWQKLVRARNWRMARGRLASGPPEPDPRVPELTKVWAQAAEIAQRCLQGIHPEHLRHACHLVALGREVSSAELRNAEVNRVVALFDMLRDPDDVTARMKWEYPEISERAGLVHFIRRMAPEAYIMTMTKYQRSKLECHWTEYDIPSLRKLARDVRDRWKDKFRDAAPAPVEQEVERETELVGDPF